MYSILASRDWFLTQRSLFVSQTMETESELLKETELTWGVAEGVPSGLAPFEGSLILQCRSEMQDASQIQV